MRTFENPANEYSESVDGWAIVLVGLFGPFYLALRGLWAHALIWVAVMTPLGYIPGVGAAPIIVGFVVLWIVYGCLIESLVAAQYLRAGWRETNYETISSSSGFAEPLRNPLRIENSER